MWLGSTVSSPSKRPAKHTCTWRPPVAMPRKQRVGLIFEPMGRQQPRLLVADHEPGASRQYVEVVAVVSWPLVPSRWQ